MQRFEAVPALARGIGCLPLLLVIASSACSTMVHDESRFTLATEARQRYADANVLEVVEADRKNLERLLAEELKVVRDNQKLQVDIALVEIANNATPMADTYAEAARRLKDLGFASPGEVRSLLEASVRKEQTERSLQTYAKAFRDAGIAEPDCKNLPANPDFAAVPDPGKRKRLQVLFPRYGALCAKLIAPALPSSGKLADAHKEWSDARKALGDARGEEAKTKTEMATAKKEFDQAVAQSRRPAEQTKEQVADLKEKTEKLKTLLEKARKLGGGLDNEEHIDALVDLLSAAAGGTVDSEQPAIKRATTLLKAVPSMAEDMGELEARRRAPPVSGLLLALRHQTSLVQDARKRAALVEERVAILRAAYDAYYGEAERWLRFTDALCSYAVLVGGGKHPGADCDEFVVTPGPACAFQGSPVANCVLESPWKERLAGTDKPPAKRELYKAIAAYLQALALQARPLEERFREIDVRHRETLLAKETALRTWDNVAAVPLDQLEAHYKAGIKPAELADLIVKALGFTAIAIGIAQ